MRLKNSQPEHLSGTRLLRRKPDSAGIITVTVVVRSASSGKSREKAVRQISSLSPHQRKHLGGDEFVRRHGARKKDLALIENFAKRKGLRVVESNRARRCVVLSGTLDAFSKAFRVDFTMHTHRGFAYRSHRNGIYISPELDGVVDAVFGLENRALMSHHAFVHVADRSRHMDPEEVAKAYHFPAKSNGKGQRIAIVELGGGFYESDIKSYFQNLKLTVPKITTVQIDGQRNDPASPDLIKKILDAMGATNAKAKPSIDSVDASKALWTIEASLDIELAGAFANGAEIVVYFAPNNAQGKYNALTSALHNTQYPPTIISCSWGAVEANLDPDFVRSLDQVFQDAALLGVTVAFSSGDSGDDPDNCGQPRVHFPASSPNVISCGGTHWISHEEEFHEVVWNEQLPARVARSGGGVSSVFSTPEWQASAGVEAKTGKKGRGVPDVAGKADMAAGYGMIVGGYSVTMGGTSSVVPLWAGLIARMNQELGKNTGYLTSFLYQHDCVDLFMDITEGNNGNHYRAEPGWDACTGLGTPNGEKLLSILTRTSRNK